MKQCKLKSKANQINNQNDKTSGYIIQSKFAYVKKSLPEKYKLKLKDAELKFVFAGSHSFNSLENDGLKQLIHTGIDINANLGLLDVKDIFYGRQTIREEAVCKFDQYTHQIRSLLEEPIKQNCIAPQLTCELMF